MAEDKDDDKTAKAKSRKKPSTIKLIEPVEWGEEVIKEITLKPIRGKHLRTLPSSPTLNDILKIASKISGVSSAVFDEMCSEDITRVSEAVGELF